MATGCEMANFPQKAILKVLLKDIFVFSWIYFVFYICIDYTCLEYCTLCVILIVFLSIINL